MNIGETVYFLRMNNNIARGEICGFSDKNYVLVYWECLDSYKCYHGRTHIPFKKAFSDLDSIRKTQMLYRMQQRMK